ncbi:hypothetical protein C6497_11950 [Candidatus Poribacteria bacterium]|nr:MAG: hypothetical protein C6497_11950 [Candidatus Poribacteria bacterium]
MLGNRKVYLSVNGGCGTIGNGNRHPIEIQYYRTPNGKEPFTEWFESIQNKNTQQRIDKRLARFEDLNFGDCKSVGGGVFELRLHRSQFSDNISWYVVLNYM